MRTAAAALAVLALAGCSRDGSEEAAAPQTVTVTLTETITETETALAEPEERCSATAAVLTLPAQDLPEPVAETRRQVFGAALDCDYERLESLAGAEGFTFSFGTSGSPAAYWRRLEQERADEPLPLRALATILTMPATRNEAGSYAWPAAYSENPSDGAWQALVVAGLYTEEQVEQMRTQGTGYLGYRTAITPDGVWQFFVAGD